MARVAVLGGFFALSMIGCGSGQIYAAICSPGEVRTCTCLPGVPGTQACGANGLDWLECVCLSPDGSQGSNDSADAQVPLDEEVDAGLDESPEDGGDEEDGGVDEGGADAGADEGADDWIDAGIDPGPDEGSDEGSDWEPTVCPATPPLPSYSGGVCPVITGGPTADTSLNAGFPSVGDARQFRMLVPANYDGSRPWPLMFAWHWLNASSASFIEDGELTTAAEEMQMLIVLPDKLRKADGDGAYLFNWPFDPTCSDEDREKELTFFDDLLSCISQQYQVDRCRVHGVGVSAGGLWLAHLSGTERVDALASVATLSGGLAQVSIWTMQFVPRANKFPALVLWGGDIDYFPPIHFNEASIRYMEALLEDNHFVVKCVHSSGHAVPPIDPPPDGGTRFRAIWDFFRDHPYGLTPGTSPYQSTGLPADYPSWCEIAGP